MHFCKKLKLFYIPDICSGGRIWIKGRFGRFMKKFSIWMCAILIALFTFLAGWLRIGYGLDVQVSDLICQRESVASKDIYIIAIDDKTLAEYGSITSWSRDIPAQLIETLNVDESVRPAVICFDVIYSENGSPEGDAHLAEACAEAGNVVMAMSYQFKEQPVTRADGCVYYDPKYVKDRILPYEGLREACDSGFANTIIGTD